MSQDCLHRKTDSGSQQSHGERTLVIGKGQKLVYLYSRVRFYLLLSGSCFIYSYFPSSSFGFLICKIKIIRITASICYKDKFILLREQQSLYLTRSRQFIPIGYFFPPTITSIRWLKKRY